MSSDPAADRIRTPNLTPRVPGPAETTTDLVSIVLLGGPPNFPENLRRQRCPVDQPTVKIEHYGGHEHFERDERTAWQRPIVYRWTTRTQIAE
jgi:hypothetical protein